MPLYEYQCESCGKVTEKIQKFSDPPLDACPSCGGAMKKLLSSPAIQFKGSGWYITDYARKSSGEGSKGTGGSGEKSETSGGEKADAAKSGSTTASESKPTASTKTETKSD